MSAGSVSLNVHTDLVEICSLMESRNLLRTLSATGSTRRRARAPSPGDSFATFLVYHNTLPLTSREFCRLSWVTLILTRVVGITAEASSSVLRTIGSNLLRAGVLQPNKV